jgi:hypothetical protein
MNQTLTETLTDLGAEDALLMDGFDDCILGILERFGIDQPIVVYDREKVIAKLMDRDGMTHEEALDFYYFNQLGAWVGEKTPAFLIKMSEDES